jgi:hypothetical protein
MGVAAEGLQVLGSQITRQVHRVELVTPRDFELRVLGLLPRDDGVGRRRPPRAANAPEMVADERPGAER